MSAIPQFSWQIPSTWRLWHEGLSCVFCLFRPLSGRKNMHPVLVHGLHGVKTTYSWVTSAMEESTKVSGMKGAAMKVAGGDAFPMISFPNGEAEKPQKSSIKSHGSSTLLKFSSSPYRQVSKPQIGSRIVFLSHQFFNLGGVIWFEHGSNKHHPR